VCNGSSRHRWRLDVAMVGPSGMDIVGVEALMLNCHRHCQRLQYLWSMLSQSAAGTEGTPRCPGNPPMNGAYRSGKWEGSAH